MTTVYLPIGHWSEGVDVLIDRVTDRLRGLVIEPNPGKDLAVRLEIRTVGDFAYDIFAAPAAGDRAP